MALISGRRYVWLVGVEVVEISEEGTVGPSPVQPVEKGRVDLPGTARLEADPLLAVKVTATQDVREDPVPGDRAGEEGLWRQRVVLEMGEASTQPGLVTAAVGVRCEPGGLIAP